MLRFLWTINESGAGSSAQINVSASCDLCTTYTGKTTVNRRPTFAQVAPQFLCQTTLIWMRDAQNKHTRSKARRNACHSAKAQRISATALDLAM